MASGKGNELAGGLKERGTSDSPAPQDHESSSGEPSTESSQVPSRQMSPSRGRTPQHQENSSGEPSANSSRAPTPRGQRTRERNRVRFNSSSEVNDETNQKSSFPLRDRRGSAPPDAFGIQLPKSTKGNPSHSRNSSVNDLIRYEAEHENPNPFADPTAGPVREPPSPVLPSFLVPAIRRTRPSLVRKGSGESPTRLQDVEEDKDDTHTEKISSALAAQERAQRIASLVGSHSAPASRRTSLEALDLVEKYPGDPLTGLPVRVDDIPLVEVGRRPYDAVETDSEDEQEELAARRKRHAGSEAHKLVQAHVRKGTADTLRIPMMQNSGLASGQVTPTALQASEDYVARPAQYRGGILSSLLKLYNAPGPSNHKFTGLSGGHSRNLSFGQGSNGSPNTPTPTTSGTNTPVRPKTPKWYEQKNQSKDTLANLIEASAMLSGPAGGKAGSRPPSIKPSRPGAGMRAQSSRFVDQTISRMSRPRLEDEIRITVHIAETLARQKYMIRLCRALMSYGAPTHRLEEYMKMTARVLEIDGQFLYIPGCMLISFDDAATHTTEVKLVRSNQGVDLGKLRDVHEIYKEVVHDVIGVEEATQRLDTVMQDRPKNQKWIVILVYGLASASVGPFAFSARPIDLPICFLLGVLVGILQLEIAPRSDMYSNVFEVTAAVLTSFLARAFGSIPYRGGTLFCFSALAQSAIALILPGYMVLCAALELQSRSMVAGSVRMVYAIIYSLFLGFGITIGTTVYGLMDPKATANPSCTDPMNQYWHFLFVPFFTLCLAYINHAKWKQMPIMLIISMVGYTINFFSTKKFPSNAQLSNTLGALGVGTMGNLHSRLRHGVAAAAMIPAIFVQVPSGLAASGSLLAGLSQAEAITNTTSYLNGTMNVNGTSSVTLVPSADTNTIVFNVGYSMIQIAIGITIGLFLSAIVVYPLGKRRSGLFSF
ncbi:MAG: hypothetical protein M1818_004196 [Claussenomyces sp. TS43310]|nr:MAG: hypothetical protein M1818_004196 [Claussenomyces sp. TS43310]